MLRVGDLGYGKDELETCLSLASAETRFTLPGQRLLGSFVRGKLRAELCPRRVWSPGLVGPSEGGCLGSGEASALSLPEEAFSKWEAEA